jgi:hypothetical protein
VREGEAKGMNAGSSSSSSSASSESPIFSLGNFGGRRKSRDCTGELEDDDAALEEGEERGSGWGECFGIEICEGGRSGLDRGCWRSCAGAGRGEVCGWVKVRAVTVVVADEFLEMVGAEGRPGVVGVSFFGIGESRRVKREDGARAPELLEVDLPCRGRGNIRPPPDPVLLIASPPADSDVLPGTGDGAFDFDTPTFLICART